MKNAFVLLACALGIITGLGCSQHPVTTGAAGYWSVAHVEMVAPRNSLEREAAREFYPNPTTFQPDPAAPAGYNRKAGMDEHHQEKPAAKESSH